MSRRNVVVTVERPGSNRIRRLLRCRMLRTAEKFIARRAIRDPIGVARGDYGIDAPEHVVNPRR